MKVILNEAEQAAMKVGCPLCGQQADKKCKSLRGDNLVPRPHKARVLHARDLAGKRTRRVKTN